MCTATYNETKCTECGAVLKSKVNYDKCYEVSSTKYTTSPLDVGGCKEGVTSVTNTKEEGMCDGCRAKNAAAAAAVYVPSVGEYLT